MLVKKNNGRALCSAILIFGVTIMASGSDWKLKWKDAGGTGKVQNITKKSGTNALKVTTPTAKSKALFLRSQKIAVQPGAEYILSGYVKSATGKASDARILLQYLDKNGKYTTVSHGIYAGGTHDWKYFKRTTKIPQDTYFVRLMAGNYMAAGTSWFDDLQLTDKAGNVIASDNFEPAGFSQENIPQITKVMPKKAPVTVSTKKTNTASSVTVKSNNWKLKWKDAGGTGNVDGQVKKFGQYALKTTTPTAKSKALFLRSQKIAVQPGTEYILSGYVKSNTSKPGNARILLQYLDKNGKYTTVSHGIYAGGKHDWKYFKRTTKIPKNIYFVRLMAGNYMAAGTSWFDELKLTDKTGKVLVTDSFEDVLTQSANVWSIPIKVAKKKIDATVEINELKSDYDLVHFTGANNLNKLSLTCDYTVVKPGLCYLSSNVGTCYWYSINLKNLKMTLLWSDEKIDISTKGKKTITIPFQQRYTRYFDPLTKGPSVIRGHHYFRIYSPDGTAIGSSSSANALAHPEAAVFGKRQVQLSKSNRGSLYTLADLNNYKLFLSDFQADWKSGGKFAFKVQVKDAAGAIFDLNKVTALQAVCNGKSLTIKQHFAAYDIPTGWFIGTFPATLGNKLTINATITVNKPAGKEQEQISATFKKSSDYPAFTCLNRAKTIASPKNEIRMVFITPHSILSQNPEIGKKQIEQLVAKAKQANINILSPFALGNRCGAECNSSNKYRRRLFKNYDPLQLFRVACTKAGIELHPSICLLPEGVETLSGILKKHPEWAMYSGDKRKGWLDPAVPEARAYRLQEIVELVKKYQLEGIMLDYARLALKPSDRGAEIYKLETGIDPRQYAYGTPEHIKWYKWESQQLDDFVGQIHTELKKINPKIKLSAYIQGNKYSGVAEWENLHQNHLKWLKKGYLDIICPTGYIYDMLRFKAWSKRQIDTCHAANPKVPCAVTIGVLSSHGALQSSQELNDQIAMLRQLGGEGASFFRWKYLEKWLKPLRAHSYKMPAKTVK